MAAALLHEAGIRFVSTQEVGSAVPFHARAMLSWKFEP
jgi:hypothetical protein